jgi:hypothetical protein
VRGPLHPSSAAGCQLRAARFGRLQRRLGVLADHLALVLGPRRQNVNRQPVGLRHVHSDKFYAAFHQIGCTVEFANVLLFTPDVSGWLVPIFWRKVMNDISVKTAAVACLLDGKAYRMRVTRIQALMDQALISRERVETSLRLRFRLDADIETRLKELVALEQECCPFLVFELARRPDAIVLTISGPESVAALLDDAFGGTAACQ